jgi:hypothetical protein
MSFAMRFQFTAGARHRNGQGDFRPGSISATGGRCGNPNCHCHKPDDPGHGPNLRLTYKVRGKTVTGSFPSPAAQRKVEREIAGFRRYRELSRTLIETNENIAAPDRWKTR